MSNDINLTEGAITEVLNDKVDLDFNNVASNSVGFARCSTEVTNCVTEIPQRIKYSLEDGVLTILKGSVVMIPNGFEEDGTTPKFDEITIESDTIVNSGGTGQTVVTYRKSDATIWGNVLTSNVASGTSYPGTASQLFYNTTVNNIRYTQNATTVEEPWSLPLGVINVSSGVVSSVQIFNGIGYIGSTIWVDKGVKGLVPNGRNEDGSQRNIEFTTNKIYLTMGNSTGIVTQKDFAYILDGEQIENTDYLGLTNLNYTVSSDGHIYNTAGLRRRLCVLGEWSCDATGKVTSVNPKTTFIALDYNDKSKIKGWSYPSNKSTSLTLGASGTQYTAPANGKFYLQKKSGKAGAYLTMYTPTHYWAKTLFAYSTNDLMRIDMDVVKGQVVQMTYNATGTTEDFKFIYAQGEI